MALFSVKTRYYLSAFVMVISLFYIASNTLSFPYSVASGFLQMIIAAIVAYVLCTKLNKQSEDTWTIVAEVLSVIWGLWLLVLIINIL